MKKNLRTFWVLIFVSILALMALKYSFNLSLYGLLVSLGWIIALIRSSESYHYLQVG